MSSQIPRFLFSHLRVNAKRIKFTHENKYLQIHYNVRFLLLYICLVFYQ